MSDLRSSQQQLRDEFAQMHREMTDPYYIERQRKREARERRVINKTKRYGL